MEAVVRATGSVAGRRVLDFGSGIGTISAVLQESGADVVAVEQSPEGRALTKVHPRIQVVGDLDQASGPFSLIVMVEVIEHLRNPRTVLERLHTILDPDGHLFITTPNLASLRARLLGPAWPMVATPHHLFYFTRRSLERTLRESGFARMTRVADASRHRELPLRRQVLQAALRPFGLDGGLQVVASPAVRGSRSVPPRA